MKTINGHQLKQMIISGANNLFNCYPEIDALNVFPVPDGDTGTNMSMTMRSCVKEVNMITTNNLEDIADAVSKGADEIDMVINIGALKDHKDYYVYEEIKYVKECCKGKLLKVIIETCLLTDEEKVRACELSKKAGADFVKTSTGFSTGGATKEDVALMRKTVGSNIGVKASGGVRTYDDMIDMVNAGANRIGTSGGPNLLSGLKNDKNY